MRTLILSPTFNSSPSFIACNTGPLSEFFSMNNFLTSFKGVSDAVILSRSSKYCQYAAPHDVDDPVSGLSFADATDTVIFPMPCCTLSPSILFLK